MRDGLGIRCAVYGGGWSKPIYFVSDLGMPGVPRLSESDIRELHRILRYAGTATLRFATVSTARGSDYIVFDPHGVPLCSGTTGSEFYVLNGACNEVFYPAEYGDSTNAASGPQSRRPWMPSGGDC